MNAKKMIFIPLAIGIVVFIIIKIIIRDPTPGEKFTASIPVETNKTAGAKLSGLTLYTDFSGSMKGFVDFSQMNDAQSVSNVFASTIGNFLDNVERDYNIRTKSHMGNQVLTKDAFKTKLREKSGFNQNTTLLHQLFKQLSSSVTDSTVSVLVSDLVLSYGKRELINKKDTFYNKNNLDALGSEIHGAINEKYDVAILQYLSSFNGRYYCNYTENIKSASAYKNQHMKNRPFYVVLVGKEDILKDIINNKKISEANNIFTSFSFNSKQEMNEVAYGVKDITAGNSIWEIGDVTSEKSKELPGTLWSDNEWGATPSKIQIECSSFNMPVYIGSLNDLEFEFSKDIVKNITDVNCTRETGLKMNVNLCNYEDLPKNGDAEIKVYKNTEWVQNCTVVDDVEKELSYMEGKTWGFSTIISAINETYYPKTNRNSKILLGKFNFKILKK